MLSASIYLGRRLLSILTTVYIPSVLLNIIGHITNYFKPFYFESAIAVNLTVMLVLTSMFISVVAGLPVTSYIKMIDIWLLFNLTIPFIDVLLTCIIDNMRYCQTQSSPRSSSSIGGRIWLYFCISKLLKSSCLLLFLMWSMWSWCDVVIDIGTGLVLYIFHDLVLNITLDTVLKLTW